MVSGRRSGSDCTVESILTTLEDLSPGSGGGGGAGLNMLGFFFVVGLSCVALVNRTMGLQYIRSNRLIWSPEIQNLINRNYFGY